ncbi:DsbA family protein [Pontibacter ruber]|uniref:DsbA family protein n=1 Tax=Pontibacter ruber TaxID=1343895 RepID=A0ABW5CWC2_9BACT|nr:DsbA family protein [Pontibacter ruber]
MMDSPYSPVLLYVTDPMCAWCYGFTPVIRRLRALWQGRLKVEVILGGLNPYAEEPLTREQKEKLAVSWHRVQTRTSLPFNYGFFLRNGFVYNTEPASRALLVVRQMRPLLTLEVLRALHSAFYVDGADLTNPYVLAQLIRPFGIREDVFLTLFESDVIMEQMEGEFDFVNTLGAKKLPSVYIEGPAGPELLATGFCQLDELEELLLKRLEEV